MRNRLHVIRPDEPDPPRGKSFKRFALPLVLATTVGVVAGDYFAHEDGPARRTAGAIRARYLDHFKNPATERALWRSRLAQRAIEIVMTCEFLSAEEKAEFRRKLDECTSEVGYRDLLITIQGSSLRYFAGELHRRFPPDMNADLHPEEFRKAKDAIFEETPQIRQLWALDYVSGVLELVGQGDPFQITLSEAVMDCERAMEYDGRTEFHRVDHR